MSKRVFEGFKRSFQSSSLNNCTSVSEKKVKLVLFTSYFTMFFWISNLCIMQEAGILRLYWITEGIQF